MFPPELGTSEWLAEELVQARLLDRARVDEVMQALRGEAPFADAAALAERFVREKLLSPYQAKRALEGDARKLVLGVYDLIAPLEPGGMGIVYRAAGRADHQPYAIKVLPLRNRWNVRLVRRQVEAFEKLPPHDAVVPFVDVGTAHGVHYLVWPFCGGSTLEGVTRDRGPLPAGEIARLGVQLAAALQHCHDHGLVHGLLKPTNVMIGYDGQGRLMDFGIGALLAENNDELESMVDTSSIAKTMAGMLECASPELVLEPTRLTPAGDQYSLGCVLYFCTTGRYPFPGGTAIDKVVAHQKQRPTPIRSLNPTLPTLLTDVIERFMHKAPEDRFRRVDEAILDLEPLARSTPQLVPPPVPVDVQTPPPKLTRPRVPSKPAPPPNPVKPPVPAVRPQPAPPLPQPAALPPERTKQRSLLNRILFFWRS